MDLATPSEDTTTTLLVDDDESVLDLVRLQLRNAGIHADIACGPRDALEKLATGRYRVVVSDIDMPEMSGVELAKRIRELDPLIQVIMLTTGNASEKLISSRVAGATDLLSKVHDLACIPAAVSEALERSRRWARLEYTEAEPTPHAPADAAL
ncbi:MAG: response regulator [Planctomycetes bacterium]|nr:response regulator [Planctomycetota bacterium]MCH8968728.1 response regulator [Planctomycetota bacterium]